MLAIRAKIILTLLTLLLGATAPTKAGAADGKWPEGKTYHLKGLQVALSAPVLVGRSKTYFWFPQIDRFSNGDLIALIRTCADAYPYVNTGAVSWSSDGGLTWSEPKPYGRTARSPEAGESYSRFFLPSGDLLLLPFVLFPRPGGGMGAPYYLVPQGKREIRQVDSGAVFAGLPYFPDPKIQMPGACTFQVDGQVVKLKDGKYLAPIYGLYKDFDGQAVKNEKGRFFATTPSGQSKRKKFMLAVEESQDGIRWKLRSTVADENCKLPGEEGPNENALCRLPDGRLMCLIRLASRVPYGQAWSSDDGKTWSVPVQASGPFSVEPSLAVMKDGTLALAGGRPGIDLWFNTDGTGKDWQKIDTREHHNAFCPKDPITDAGSKNTTSYAEVIATDPTHLVYIYDRIANGWNPIPKGSPETYSVWVVRVSLEKTTD